MMYKVYFQIWTKKLLVNVEAYSIEEAKQKVEDTLKFDKIIPVQTTNDDEVFNRLMNIFGFKK
jgi:hypothetical protein